MNAGRELDALIAEKVMGYTKEVAAYTESLRLRSIIEDKPPGTLSIEHMDLMKIEMTHDSGPYGSYRFFPHYSTDISAAWEIVEKLRDDNFSIEENGTHWKARFGIHWRGAETAPHAICLAALETLEK